MEEWEGVFDVDRVGWDDCALVVGGGVESVVYGVGEVGGRVVSRHRSDFAWRVVVGGERGGHEGGSARAP